MVLSTEGVTYNPSLMRSNVSLPTEARGRTVLVCSLVCSAAVAQQEDITRDRCRLRMHRTEEERLHMNEPHASLYGPSKRIYSLSQSLQYLNSRSAQVLINERLFDDNAYSCAGWVGCECVMYVTAEIRLHGQCLTCRSIYCVVHRWFLIALSFLLLDHNVGLHS